MVCGMYSSNPQALVTNCFTCYVYIGATTTILPSAYYLALPPQDQAKLSIGKVLVQNHYQYYQLNPCWITSINSGRSMHHLYIPPSSPTKDKHLQKQLCLEQHMESMMDCTCEASPEYATATWLLEDSRFPHQNLCHSIVHVPGITIDVNAYHTELQGLHALLLAIKAICSFYLVTSGLVLVGCENLGTPLHQAQQLQALTPSNPPPC